MIKLTKDAEKIALVNLIGSRNPVESKAAQEAFAAAVGPVIGEVLSQAGTASLIYEDWAYNPDDQPSIPLDIFYGEGAGLIPVWFMPSIAGGLPSSQIESAGEMKVSTYTLETAVNFAKKYARKSNFNVLNMAISRMTQEILIKQERQAWAVIMRALGEAVTAGTKHTIAASSENVLQVDDFNRLLTLNKRINQSFANGTPTSVASKGITDLFLSPEMKEQIRGFAYQPMNTRVGTLTTNGATAVPLPDAIRQAIFNSAGDSSIYNVNIIELNELGVGQKYNTLFGNYATANISFGGNTNFDTSSSTALNGGDEILVGIDLSKGAFKRVVETDPLSNSTFTVSVDNQFLDRSDRVGFFGNVSEGRVAIDARAINGLIV